MSHLTGSEFSKNLKLNIWVDLASSQWSLTCFKSFPSNFPEEAEALRLPTLHGRTPFLSYSQYCFALSDLEQLFPFFFLSSIFVVNKNMCFQLFCIDKGKDSTSDLDQEIDFSEENDGCVLWEQQNAAMFCLWPPSWRHLWTLPRPRPRTSTNSGHHCSSRHCLAPQSHFQRASVVFHNMK